MPLVHRRRQRTRLPKNLKLWSSTNVQIELAREKYRVLATRGSLIYGVISDTCWRRPHVPKLAPVLQKVVCQHAREGSPTRKTKLWKIALPD